MLTEPWWCFPYDKQFLNFLIRTKAKKIIMQYLLDIKDLQIFVIITFYIFNRSVNFQII